MYIYIDINTIMYLNVQRAEKKYLNETNKNIFALINNSIVQSF